MTHTMVCILRVRGGSSKFPIQIKDIDLVFSAYAEVVPMIAYAKVYVSSILRVRGGSSSVRVSCGLWGVYSPRTRR